jgi:hypothetical protein
MNYIRINNDSAVINVGGSLHTITRKTLNFNKICKLLENQEDEETILQLLAPVELSEGIYELYEDKESSFLYAKHFTKEGDESIIVFSAKSYVIKEEDYKFLGVYKSKEDIQAEWPEYML